MESNEELNETYFIISIIDQDISNMKQYSNKLNNIIGLKWKTYYEYHGLLDLVVDQESIPKLIKVMMKNLQAENVNIYSSGKTCSATGYSQLLKNLAPEIQINNENVNVQIAVQIDEIKNQTQIIIGSPLILGNY